MTLDEHRAIEETRRANLATLAAYLKAPPADYKHMDMGSFMRAAGGIGGVQGFGQYIEPVDLNVCGTSACAVGHGLNAGVQALKHETWDSYTERAFCSPDGIEFDWMFGGSWDEHDNTPAGAAFRIEYYLKHGIPVHFGDEEGEEDYGTIRNWVNDHAGPDGDLYRMLTL